MKPEISLPHSQVPATGPYHEPARSSPCPHIHLLKIHLNIIFPSTPGTSKWPPSLRFPHQNRVYASPLPHTGYMPGPSHSSRFDHSNNTSFSSSLCSFLHSPVTSPLLGPNILLSAILSNTLSLRSSLNVSDQVSHPYTTGKIIVLYIFIFLDSNLEDQRFCTE